MRDQRGTELNPRNGVSAITVAIIEDDPSFRRALHRLLGLGGFCTETFASAEEFLHRPSSYAPDCIVLDIHLGGMSGLELQAELAASSVTIPIVFITAFDEPATQQRALEGGAAGYLQKPVDDLLLMEAILGALGRDPTAMEQASERPPKTVR